MKNKRMDHLSNTVFFTKNLNIFFSKQEKLETCRNLNFKNSRRPSFGDDMNVTCIS